MIALTRLNHAQVILNCDLIETIEVTPDTIICLTTGQKLAVLESMNEILEKVTMFRRSVSRIGGAKIPSATPASSPTGGLLASADNAPWAPTRETEH